MRIWRDVISVDAWKRVAARVNTSSGYHTKPDLSLRMQSVFKHRYRSPEDFMNSIERRLESYHSIPKTDIKRIPERIEKLQELSEIARDYLRTYKINDGVARKRNANKSGGLPPDGRHGAYYNSPDGESVDRNVLSLEKRALRKAYYLQTLKQYYTKGDGRKWRDATALLAYIGGAQERTGSKVGLVPHVRMEQLDFMHRGDYELDDTDPDISCGKAFKEWTNDVNAKATPFFLWLEGHPVCLEDDKGLLSSRSVEYMEAAVGKPANPIRKLKLVHFSSPLQATDLVLNPVPTAVASTKGYKADAGKDPRQGGWGDDVAAYAWTEARELFIAEHVGCSFHHSSFLSGRRVRCAGMIVIDNGKVVGLSNNSGHYRPGKEHLLKLYMAFRQKNVMPVNASIELQTGAGAARMTAAEFWRDYFTF
jgi:hypothetical protein